MDPSDAVGGREGHWAIIGSESPQQWPNWTDPPSSSGSGSRRRSGHASAAKACRRSSWAAELAGRWAQFAYRRLAAAVAFAGSPVAP